MRYLIIAVALSGCVETTKNLDVIECRKLCYPAQAYTSPLNRAPRQCGCLWPASQGDAGVTEVPTTAPTGARL